ncbi:polyprenyl synthetase family protein [Streptomyces sp. WI04-05B]|uniref:polyprenyl synthetase family protein n=1 Tax=Streptomyces TaxID=1883 RepID=UPI0029BD78E7|nr:MULTISPECIES: polyprenyl synthetase family protein [unclassified Streptomyces]MDX2543849.1 polyprenyl synthetase family protein [Streptomyces sp. WI04-05B]MDX2582061.1 polyprenyl synthetase family protein [Streptomyces sp. WI04-05A]MDX3752473.1 polyprenyl synthetase family protein [Streptomyces sp. AK08-02]
MGATERVAEAAGEAVGGVAAVVRGDAALLEDDLAEFLGSLTAPAGVAAQSVYEGALRRSLYEPVADAVGSKVGQEALAPTAGAPGGNRAPLRPSMVYWAYRNYRGFPHETGSEALSADMAVVRRAAVAVRVMLKAFVAIDDIQDGSDVRYGEPALHVTHGVPLALNTGSWLIAAVLRHAADPAVVDSLVRAVENGFTGQAVDLSTRTAETRAELLAAPLEERVAYWESLAALKTGTLFRMPLDSALAALRVVDDEQYVLDAAMRQLGLASQLFNDLTDFVPEFGGGRIHEDYDGLSNRVFLELLDPDTPALTGERLKAYVLGHPELESTLLSLAAEAVQLKRDAKESVYRVCRSDRSAAYFDLTIERKGHLIDRLHETLQQRSGA